MAPWGGINIQHQVLRQPLSPVAVAHSEIENRVHSEMNHLFCSRRMIRPATIAGAPRGRGPSELSVAGSGAGRNGGAKDRAAWSSSRPARNKCPRDVAKAAAHDRTYNYKVRPAQSLGAARRAVSCGQHAPGLTSPFGPRGMIEIGGKDDSWQKPACTHSAHRRGTAAGVYKGRRPSVDVLRVRALKQEGVGPSAIAKTLGIGRASVYRALGERTAEA